MSGKLIFRGGLALLLGYVATAQADDIDLFTSTPPGVTAPPNVLIVLDNTANWNAPFENEKNALISVVGGLAPDKFRLGLMMFTESGGGNTGNDGGYVRAAIRDLSTANKPLFQALVNSLDSGDDKSNGGKVAKTMEEAYLYFSAGTPHAGNKKNKADYVGNVSGTTQDNAIYALAGNALASKNATSYRTPIADGCAKNFIIYISNGAAQDNNSDLSQATAALTAAGGSTTTIPISPSGSQGNVADEWTRFMKKSELGITTYTIDINKVTTGQGPGWTALLKSMAGVSGGRYFDVANDGTAIANALNSVFSEIQSVNSVFSSVSLPVSVNTQGTYLNQVYIGMFRPDQDSRPLWPGNLKQYKLGLIDGSLKLQDAAGVGAINTATGFVTECARSFWTPGNVDNYWAFRPQGECLLVPNSDVSNYPDGNVVEKGAQGYMLRLLSNVTGRTVKTCGLASCSGLVNFNNTTVTGAQLNPSSPLNNTDRDALINWARGLDVNDEDLDGITTAEMRPSVHGDVVHSSPVAINYGGDAAGSRSVVLFYGANDGMLHAVNGNRPDLDNTTIGGKAPGQELWSFMAPEFYPKLKRLKDNSPLIAYPGQPAVVPAAEAKGYGMDGPVVSYVNGTTARIFASMRRGGRHLYAFDVSTPQSPTLLWRKGCPNMVNPSGVTGCSAGFDDIGQTWSEPRVVMADGFGSGTSPMLLMGGGYDACEDTDNGIVNNSCTATATGRKVYLLNAETGAILKSFETERSVTSRIAVVFNTGLNTIKYAYVADTGGNLYRISGATANTPIGATVPGSWTMTKIASLGCDTIATCLANRKFMFEPAVVVVGSTHYVLLGSGDREKPVLSYAAASGINNHFFMVKDMPADPAWLSSENATCGSGANVICLDSLTPILSEASPADSDLLTSKGWYLGLKASEQVVTASLTVFGSAVFSTSQPVPAVPGQCSNLGEARVYNINYLNAASTNGAELRYEDIVGDSLPPSPVAGLVTLDDGSTVPFLIGGSGDSPFESAIPEQLGLPEIPGAGTSSSAPASRVYWNLEQ